MKRRNVECGKIRRSVKRNKITEGIYGSTLLYLKFLLLWLLVILADFLLEFRFEFLWPFWLLVRSVYDSYKYQGLAFSVFFVCIALTSDMVCFFFIPVHWLFFAASTYVWVQYVWHTDKGICLPTIILWMLFVYLEAAVRLKDLRHLPFHLDLCRPFAAHCIGYPVVTLGFGFKSYVGYRIRQRKQKDVAKENEFYAQLLQQALPVDSHTTTSNGTQQCMPGTNQTEIVTQPVTTTTTTVTSSKSTTQHTNRQHNNSTQNIDKWKNTTEISQQNGGILVNHCIQNGTIPHNTKNNHRKSVDKVNNTSSAASPTSLADNRNKYVHLNGGTTQTSSPINNDISSQEYTTTDQQTSTTMSRSDELFDDTTNTITTNNDNNIIEKERKTTTTCNNFNNKTTNKCDNKNSQKKNKHNNNNNNNKENNDKDGSTNINNNNNEYVQRLEWDLKRLRNELQTSRNNEQELRTQINTFTSTEKCLRLEVSQLQRDNEELQNKIQVITGARQAERQALERRAGEERRARAAVEAQLAHERRSQQQRRHEEQQAQQHNKSECTEQCKSRRRELECEARDLRSALRTAEERLSSNERERSAAVQQQHDADILMSALSAMQDKNQHLEDSLSAETRIKLDLFSALGEAKRQLEIRDNLIRCQEKEIDELKSKIAQVLAVMPNDTFGSPTPSSVSSRVRLAETPPCQAVVNVQSHPVPTSQLDPNATAYTPKNSLVAGTEA
ncbi:macoilin [Chrysoperla carnea]|uniref:macoilin n=1 Tax=Chrysoperla carnea TaxID=189513 RepID=UPI001D07718A|nr:macoilin [Chrysoperla carnea]